MNPIEEKLVEKLAAHTSLDWEQAEEVRQLLRDMGFELVGKKELAWLRTENEFMRGQISKLANEPIEYSISDTTQPKTTCSECGGTGWLPGYGARGDICGTCKGKGEV